MLKIWKMAADFQNVYCYNVCLCSSVVLADVLEHNCNPAGENELCFVVGTCVFLSHSSVLPPELHRGKKCGCWLLVSLMKCGCCSSLKEEKTISKSSNKMSSMRGSSDPGSLASGNSDEMIWFNLFCFLRGKKVQFHLSRKNYRKFHSNGKRSLKAHPQSRCYSTLTGWC